MIGIEKIPELEVIDSMILYTKARIEIEQNILGVHALTHHLGVYYRMGDVLLNNVVEVHHD